MGMIDPDTMLDNLRSAAKELSKVMDHVNDSDCPQALAEVLTGTAMLVENIEELDKWLSKGGFLPEAWRKAF